MTDSKKKEFKIIEVKGKAFYANVHKPTAQFDKSLPPVYKLDLVVDSKEAKELKALGLSPAKKKITENDVESFIPKEYPEFPGKRVFTFKRKTVKADGTETKPLPVVDAKTSPIPKNILIGNGSDVIASINPYSVQTKTGLVHSANLLAVQVLNLVPYESSFKEHSFTQKEGFTVGTLLPDITKVDDDDEAIPY